MGTQMILKGCPKPWFFFPFKIINIFLLKESSSTFVFVPSPTFLVAICENPILSWLHELFHSVKCMLLYSFTNVVIAANSNFIIVWALLFQVRYLTGRTPLFFLEHWLYYQGTSLQWPRILVVTCLSSSTIKHKEKSPYFFTDWKDVQLPCIIQNAFQVPFENGMPLSCHWSKAQHSS